MGVTSIELTLLSLLLYFFQFTCCLSLDRPLCHGDERLALLQFKESLVVEKRASVYESAYPKADRWEFQGVDCCSWEGIECDHNTGHVIGLDLSSSCLYGSINSTSTLFHLVHLRRLNLADNDFSSSQEIPSRLGNLTMLTYLNLSNSLFSGQIPSGISGLSRLTSLDLSYTLESDFGYPTPGLKLERPDLESLIQNLTALKHLHLSCVNISSPVPSILANFSSLTSVDLSYCGLFGELPTTIFRLPNLQFLEVSSNFHLTGTLPVTFSSMQLKVLSMGFTNFSGVLPSSIGDLHSLEFLDVSACGFRGVLPSSLGNLTKLTHLALLNNSFIGDVPSSLSNLTQMAFLSLGMNNFNLNSIPSWFSNLYMLNELRLSFCRIKGPIPSFLANLTQLSVLNLNHNQFTGQFPVGITNLTQLTYLSLASNLLDGELPNSIFRLENLQLLELYSNRLSGIVELDQFRRLEHLTVLYLSSNSLTLLPQTTSNITFPMFNELGLASCNLRQFPNFLRDQNQLVYLDLSHNNIHGQIPKWIWEMSTETLYLVDLSYNYLIGFQGSPTILPWSNVLFLDLSSNLFQGSPPVPSFSIFVYLASNNTFTGEIPQSFCHLTSLEILDLSRNNLGGIIPQCLSNFSESLSVLNLHVNSFHGSIPQAWISGGKLKMLNLGQNYLQGKLPRSIAGCKRLEFLDIGNNQIRDTFPFWLESLPELKILILRSNKFHGEIKSKEFNYSVFPKLRVIDLSNNGFGGPLPSTYLESLNAMKSLYVEHLSYMQTDLYDHMFMAGLSIPDEYNYSMTLTNKGIKMEYVKILEVFMAIDLSCNQFRGEIPESVATLKGLQLLNLSNNILDGHIPSVLGTLTRLEALDLSQNKLVGRIPWQLNQLNFLEVFNVSHNQLSGPIPQGKQFGTFPYTSFVGNPGLCGNPLSKKCEDSVQVSPAPSSTSEQNQGSRLSIELEWKGVLLGFGFGFLVGMILGCIVVTRNLNWFARTFRIRLGRTRRPKK
ncbi:hypothetical protein PTKIN_Ptkin09bG0093300 [Pterospermum kingtungense]